METVLDLFDIRCRSLFVGQNVESTESAVLEWQSNNEDSLDDLPCPVLLVQAGAAASGLTLTAASKMFLMEPFLRYSEELQACTLVFVAYAKRTFPPNHYEFLLFVLCL